MDATNGLIVFTLGFGFGSGIDGPFQSSKPDIASPSGLEKLSQQYGPNYEKAVFSWDQQEKAIDRIKEFHATNPDAPIVLVGHSFGADANVEIAEELSTSNIGVDKMVSIDSVGLNNDQVPKNVESAVNIYSTSRVGINGLTNMHGAQNIGVDNTSHTEIDDDPRTWSIIEGFLHES